MITNCSNFKYGTMIFFYLCAYLKNLQYEFWNLFIFFPRKFHVLFCVQLNSNSNLWKPNDIKNAKIWFLFHFRESIDVTQRDLQKTSLELNDKTAELRESTYLVVELENKMAGLLHGLRNRSGLEKVDRVRIHYFCLCVIKWTMIWRSGD